MKAVKLVVAYLQYAVCYAVEVYWVVAGNNQGHTVFFQIQQQFDCLRTRIVIHVGNGFIKQQYLWIPQPGAGDGHTLALAPGQGLGGVVCYLVQVRPLKR